MPKTRKQSSEVVPQPVAADDRARADPEDSRLVFCYRSEKHNSIWGRYSALCENRDLDTHGTWHLPSDGDGHSLHTRFSGLFNKFGPSGKNFYFYEAFYKLSWLILLAFGGGLTQSLVGLILSFARCMFIAVRLPHNSTGEALYELVIAGLQHLVLWYPVLGFMEVFGWGTVSAAMIRRVLSHVVSHALPNTSETRATASLVL